jgi:hypothetical protein
MVVVVDVGVVVVVGPVVVVVGGPVVVVVVGTVVEVVVFGGSVVEVVVFGGSVVVVVVVDQPSLSDGTQRATDSTMSISWYTNWLIAAANDTGGTPGGSMR